MEHEGGTARAEDDDAEDAWRGAARDHWEHVCRLNREDAGETFVRDSDFFPRSFASYAAPLEVVWARRARWNHDDRDLMLRFAREYRPDLGRYTERVLAAREPGMPVPGLAGVPADAGAAPPPDEAELLGLLAAEDLLTSVMRKLVEDDLEAWMRGGGVDPTKAAEARRFADVCVPHA